MKQFYLRSAILLLIISTSTRSFAQPVLGYNPKISSLSSPIDIVNAGDGTNRVFVVQQGGIIKVYDASLSPLGNFLTVTGITSGGERGLLSLAFHPDYENNGFFFVYYTNASGDIEIARYHATGISNTADPLSKVILLTIPHPSQSNHNGGKLFFGPDGYLYFGTGDGGSGGDPPNNAQTGTVLLGKMLRIAVTTSAVGPFYTIPADNPFISDPTVADEVWSLGLRNPWRWSFDRANGNMWIADVGQNAWEEVNYLPAGATGGLNFGWRCYEGTHAFNTSGCLPFSSYKAPIFEYPHNNATGGFSITGGYVYRGSEFPVLNGYYICADYVSGNQWKISSSGPGTWNIYMQQATGLPANIATFGEAEDGTLYAASLSGGVVYKVEVSAVLPARLIEFMAQPVNGVVVLRWRTAFEQNLLQFEVEYSTDGLHYQQAGIVPAINNSNGSNYQFQHNAAPRGRVFYRLKMVDNDSKLEYSNVVSLDNDKTMQQFVFPSFINTSTMTLFLNDTFKTIELISSNGQLVLKRNLGGQTGRLDIPLPALPAGTYIVNVKNEERTLSQKVIIN